MNVRYPTVLFDWDGTVGKTLPVWMDAYRKVCADFGLSPTDQEIGAQFGDWHGVLRLGLAADDYEPFWDSMQPLIADQLALADIYPGAAQLLRQLAEFGASVALVTTSTRALVQPALERHGITDCFGAIVTAEDVSNHKPHREPIDKALSILGVENVGVVMIGDSDNDLRAANAAGVDSVWLNMPDHAGLYDEAKLLSLGPTHRAESFTQLKTLLMA